MIVADEVTGSCGKILINDGHEFLRLWQSDGGNGKDRGNQPGYEPPLPSHFDVCFDFA